MLYMDVAPGLAALDKLARLVRTIELELLLSIEELALEVVFLGGEEPSAVVVLSEKVRML